MNQEQTSQTAAKILIIDDQTANLDVLINTLEPEGYDVLLVPSGEVALQVAPRAIPDLILLDILMPGMDGHEVCRRLKQNETTAHIPVIFLSAKDETESIVAGFQVGGVDYITKPFQTEEVLIRVETHLKISQLAEALRQKNTELTLALGKLQQEIARREQAEEAHQIAEERFSIISQQEAERWGIAGFVAQSQTMAGILTDIRRLHHRDTTSVLITGESGTGKELIARAIHFGGSRSEGQFVPVNCSAIPRELAESLLFGHVRGSFTGANADRKGYFDLAHGGTLFLDEIGSMSFDLQSKLLRALEEDCITPVGSTEPKRVDVRILAATNTDLQVRIAEGAFREDLYFRLARFTVTVPPLRERKEDISLLAHHFLKMFAAEMGIEHPSISPQALVALQAYDFPGNVRELKNIIEHALILSGESEIQPEHLHFITVSDFPTRNAAFPPPEAQRTQRAINLEELETLVVKRAQVRRADEASDQQTAPCPQTHEERILAYVREHGSISNPECRDFLSVDYHRASYLLKKMHRYGLLVREGERRWSRYRLP